MIESAEEYKGWFDRPRSDERHVKLREPARADVWLEIIERYPECRFTIAQNRHLPEEVKSVLALDEDDSVSRRFKRRISPQRPIWYRLTEAERTLLLRGLECWGGPTAPSRGLLLDLGYDSAAMAYGSFERFARDIRADRAMPAADWSRALLATEIAFGSDIVGAGLDWAVYTGLPDESVIPVLRELQLRLGRDLPLPG